ncbi:putative phi ETA-like protein [Staphylococcus aureus]|nr:putative phi ETA-like protein [Staphylococcus aureus]
MKFIRSQEPISATKDSDLKRFKGAHGLLYEQELGLQATIFDI